MQAYRAQYFVEAKPGAGNIGTDVVAKAPSDGHTLLLGTAGTHAINPSLSPVGSIAHLSGPTWAAAFAAAMDAGASPDAAVKGSPSAQSVATVWDALEES